MGYGRYARSFPCGLVVPILCGAHEEVLGKISDGEGYGYVEGLA